MHIPEKLHDLSGLTNSINITKLRHNPCRSKKSQKKRIQVNNIIPGG